MVWNYSYGAEMPMTATTENSVADAPRPVDAQVGALAPRLPGSAAELLFRTAPPDGQI